MDLGEDMPSVRGPKRVGDLSRPRFPQRPPIASRCPLEDDSLLLLQDSGDAKLQSQKEAGEIRKEQKLPELQPNINSSQVLATLNSDSALILSTLKKMRKECGITDTNVGPDSNGGHEQLCSDWANSCSLEKSVEKLHTLRKKKMAKRPDWQTSGNQSVDIGQVGNILARNNHSDHSTAAAEMIHTNHVPRVQVQEESETLPSPVRTRELSSDCSVQDVSGRTVDSDNWESSGSYQASTASVPGSLIPHSSVKQEATSMSYMKLKVWDATDGQDFTLTIVATEMSRLMDIFSLLNAERDAKFLCSGTSSEALVEEMSQQIGRPLMVVRLHSLPPGGRYSAQELHQLSRSYLARQKPLDWVQLVQKCQRYGIDFILVSSQVSGDEAISKLDSNITMTNERELETTLHPSQEVIKSRKAPKEYSGMFSQ